VYSLPNCVLPLLGGIASDYFGNRIMLVVFASLVAGGQLVCTCGMHQQSLNLVLVGRVIFGLGGESLSVVSSSLVSSWFAGAELALALGVNLSFSRLGSVTNDLASPWAAAKFGLPAAYGLGLLLCLMSLTAALLLACLDSSNDTSNSSEVKKSTITISNNSTMGNSKQGAYGAVADAENDTVAPLNDTLSSSGVAKDSSSGRSHVTTGKLLTTPKLERRPRGTPGAPGFRPKPGMGRSPLPTSVLEGTTSGGASGGLACLAGSPLRGMSGGYWLLAAHCTVVYSAIFPFNNVSAALLDSVYGMSGTSAATSGTAAGWSVGAVQGIPYSVAAVATPLVGILVDKYGHRAAWMSASAALLSAAHGLLWAAAVASDESFDVTQDDGIGSSHASLLTLPAWLASPLLPFTAMGIGYSIVAGVVWPSAMCVVDPSSTATAFGVLNSAQNLATALVPLLVAAQLNMYGTQNYAPPEALFSFLSLGSLGFALALWRWDYTKAGGGVLTHPTKGTPVTQATPAPTRRPAAERTPLVATLPPPKSNSLSSRFFPQVADSIAENDTRGSNTASSGVQISLV